MFLGSRIKRNFWAVNVAGWMSASGGWLGGYYPTIAGIIIGGILGGAANAISTWLAWENKNDEEVELIAIKLFPILSSTILTTQQKLLYLESLLKAMEDDTSVQVSKVEMSSTI